MGQELAGRGGPAAVSDPSMLDPSVHLGTIPREDRPGWCLFMEHDPGVKGTWTPGLGEMAEGHTFCLDGSRLCVGHKEEVKVKAAQLYRTLCTRIFSSISPPKKPESAYCIALCSHL